MKASFELKAWMTENREIVIEKYNTLTNSEFFNGISMKDFMVQAYNMMVANNIKSEKRASSLLPFVLGQISADNSKVMVGRDRDAELASKYKGTATMALI